MLLVYENPNIKNKYERVAVVTIHKVVELGECLLTRGHRGSLVMFKDPHVVPYAHVRVGDRFVVNVRKTDHGKTYFSDWRRWSGLPL